MSSILNLYGTVYPTEGDLFSGSFAAAAAAAAPAAAAAGAAAAALSGGLYGVQETLQPPVVGGDRSIRSRL